MIELQSDVKADILLFCDKYIPIYEDKIRRYKLATLVNNMQKAIRNHFKERLVTIRSRLSGVWKLKMEAVSNADWITYHIFDMDEEVAMLQDILKEFYMDAGEAGRLNALRHLSNILGYNVVYKGSILFVEQNAIKWGKKYAGTISETTEKAIRNQLATAIKEGEGIGDAMKRISDVYHAATGYRSEMIARTEMGRAYNIGGARQDAELGITQFEGCIGCDPDCLKCGPFQSSNPHTLEEIEDFEGSVHPNHVGSVASIVPEGFVPKETY